jgi:hypothetical protein
MKKPIKSATFCCWLSVLSNEGSNGNTIPIPIESKTIVEKIINKGRFMVRPIENSGTEKLWKPVNDA